jgi:hypothetical protein
MDTVPQDYYQFVVPFLFPLASELSAGYALSGLSGYQLTVPDSNQFDPSVASRLLLIFVPKNGISFALAVSGWKNFVKSTFQSFSSLL